MATLAQWEATVSRIFTTFTSQLASVTYSQYVPGTYNPTTDAYDGTPNTLVANMAITENVDDKDHEGSRELTGWMKSKDFRDGSISEPLSVNDSITYGSDTLRIKAIERVPESSSPVAYKFTLTTRAK